MEPPLSGNAYVTKDKGADGMGVGAMRWSVLAGLALLASAAGAAKAQDADYPANGAVLRAEAKAKAAAGACESELKAGRSGPACERYHKAVLDALGRERQRLDWCNPRMSEAANYPIPPACLSGQGEMRIETVEGLERKIAPKTWKTFDDQMAKYQ